MRFRFDGLRGVCPTIRGATSACNLSAIACNLFLAWSRWGMMTMEWQPIETAPRDDLLLGYAEGMMRLVMWENGGWLQVGATIEQGWFKPTHWMPLPDPPKPLDKPPPGL